MPFHRTGSPELDAIIKIDAVRDLIERRVRYNQSRMLEAMLAAVMVAIGVAFLSSGDTMALPSFRVIRTIVSETTAGWISLLAGGLRLWALWMNGRQNMPPIRIAGSAGGILFWAAWSIGLYKTSPPLVPLAPVAVVFAVFEFVAVIRATRDAYASNSFNLRRRKRTALHGRS